jgi:hypothetical protein
MPFIARRGQERLHPYRIAKERLYSGDSRAGAAVKPQPPDPTTRWLGLAMVIFALAVVGLLILRAVQIARSP